jgi:uncharacterized protein DUF3768
MSAKMENRQDERAGCFAAMAQYVEALVAVLLEAGLTEEWGEDEEIWENVTLMMPQQASAAGYLPAPSVCLEVGDLDLYGDRIEWRGRTFPVDVPKGYRAVAPRLYVVQIVTQEEALRLEADGAIGDELFLDPQTRKIRRLNDVLRTTAFGGKVCLTPGVGVGAVGQEVLQAVMDLDPTLAAQHDPTGRNEFGVVTVKGGKFIWKIDYYDRTLSTMSPDPADPLVTKRVLTILRPHEW